MCKKSKQAALEQQIAKDQMDYLRDHPSICAMGGAYGHNYVRYQDGDWQAVQTGELQHRLSDYLSGKELDQEDALEWFQNRPVELRPCSMAAEWISNADNLWEKVNEQDVFSDVNRCFWCGISANQTTLKTYQTTDQGICDFCSECYEAWDKQNEIREPI